MLPTRRTFLLLSAVSIGGCLSAPERRCSGATVRLSLRPTAADPSFELKTETLSAEAVGVLETAIEDEHVEHCVSWDPAPDETGPSPGLSAIAGRIESHAGIELTDRTEPVELDVRYDDDDYRLTLAIERSE